MNAIERSQRRQELQEIVGTWPGRLASLAARPEEPLSERAFCLKHNIPAFSFNRTKNLHVEPRESRVLEIEAAFKAEGV